MAILDLLVDLIRDSLVILLIILVDLVLREHPLVVEEVFEFVLDELDAAIGSLTAVVGRVPLVYEKTAE